MKLILILVICLGCSAATYGIVSALHIGAVGTVGIGFVITMLVLNITGVMR